MTKGKAFILCLGAVMVIFFTMIIIVLSSVKDGVIDITLIPVGPCLTAIGALVTAYITGNVADHGVKGKFWNQQMWESENNRPERTQSRPIESIRGDI